MGGIPWVTSDPSAYARAEQKLRELGTVSGMAGAVTGAAVGIRQRQDVEDQENAAIAQLKARLGIQQDKAVQQSASAEEGLSETPISATDPNFGVTTVSHTPWQGETRPGSAQNVTSPEVGPASGTSRQSHTEPSSPVETLKGIGKGALGVLAGAGRGLGLLHDPARGARKMQLGQLLGQSENRDRQLKGIGQVGKLASLLQPESAGRLLGGVAPSYFPTGGAVQFKPPAEKNPTTAGLALQASKGDPHAIAALASLKDLRERARQDPWFERTLEAAEAGDAHAKKLISDWLYARHSSSMEREGTNVPLTPAPGGIFETPAADTPTEDATPDVPPGLWERLFGASKGAASTDMPPAQGQALVDQSFGKVGVENPVPEKKAPLKSRTGRTLGY